MPCPGILRHSSLQIWTRPLGLAGVWGAMVEDWLDELLPDDADVICRERVHLLVRWLVGGEGGDLLMSCRASTLFASVYRPP